MLQHSTPDSATATASGYRPFPDTPWSVVLAAGQGRSPRAVAALNTLWRDYWPPLYSFLRRAGHNPHEAQDLVQGFLARLHTRDDLSGVGPEKGRLRTFLLTSLRNFVVNQALRGKAVKRGAGHRPVSLEAAQAEVLCQSDAQCASPEVAFQRRWTLTILETALRSLAAEHAARGRQAQFEALQPFLDGADDREYQAVAVRLGMTPGAVAVAIHRMRLRLRELVRAEVAKTVTSRADLDAELQHMLEIWP